MLDLNEAGEQRSFGDVVPDGSFVHLGMKVRPGGAQLPPSSPLYSPRDNGFFKASTRSDAIMMDAEFTVIDGEHKGRKLFENMTVYGGQVDDRGVSKGWNITKDRMRAMIDSCMGLDFKNTSAEAKAARQIDAFVDLDNIHFWAKLRVLPGDEILQDGHSTGRFYPPKNAIERIVIPGDDEYAPLRNGQHVAPKPSSAAHVTASARPAAAAPAAHKPAWGGGAAAAAAPLAGANAQTAGAPSTGTASAASTSSQPTQAGAAPAASPFDGGAPKPKWMTR